MEKAEGLSDLPDALLAELVSPGPRRELRARGVNKRLPGQRRGNGGAKSGKIGYPDFVVFAATQKARRAKCNECVLSPETT